MNQEIKETVLAEGKFSKANILAIISGIIAALTLVYSILWDNNIYIIPKRGPILRHSHSLEYYMPFITIGIPMLIIAAIFYVLMNSCKITVTDKRVYGIAAFRKRVDLPFDKISAVGGGIFRKITVASSSGKITFYFVKNRDEVFNSITKQLINRQEIISTPIKQEIQQSNADELKKYKTLLDDGVITQEEFDAKKKQLLGL